MPTCARARPKRTRPHALSTSPYQQSHELNEMTFYVRGSGTATETMPEQLRQAVRRADTGMPIYAMQTMDGTVDEALFNERMLALLSASFGLLATVLAAIGLYGVMSYTVARRTREIGIRIALGAERLHGVWMVLREVAFLDAGWASGSASGRRWRSADWSARSCTASSPGSGDAGHRCDDARGGRAVRRLYSRPPRRTSAASLAPCGTSRIDGSPSSRTAALAAGCGSASGRAASRGAGPGAAGGGRARRSDDRTRTRAKGACAFFLRVALGLCPP